MMTLENRKKATIADVMILVVGAGVALSAWRFIMRMPIWSGFPDSLQWYYFQALGMASFLAPLSLTLLVIAWRRDRPRLRRVVSGPAAVVGLSAFFVLVINTTLLLTIMGLVGWSPSTFTGGKVFYFCRLLAEQTGMAIGSAWLIPLISGRCPGSRSWIDISGWILGACWILLAVASIVFTLL
jgi:hypothetical protein